MAGPTRKAADRRPLPREQLTLSLQLVDRRHRGVVPRHRVARWLRAALLTPAQMTVRIVGVDEGRALNRDFRGSDHATNVLTFGYATAPSVFADLVLCAPVVEREAAELGLGLAAHYAHLLVHGALHAQGFDHEHPSQADAMERRETAILAGLGIADPYAHWTGVAPPRRLRP
ncbi:MAG: rRNA maturation RNase YbeY [Caldimonas sp.]